MCGIIGYTGSNDAAPILLGGLASLEYRGYDSAGIATLDDDTVTIRKAVGEVEELRKKTVDPLPGTTGIGHTRWATHGGVTKENAHPHTCECGRITVAHNGIVENYEELKDDLLSHEYSSETDSEVIAHYICDRMRKGASGLDAVQQFMDVADGTMAVAVLKRDTGTIYGLKDGSPLNIGVGDDEYFLGSDVHAFIDHTHEAIFLEDGDIAAITADELMIYRDGERITREPVTIDETNISNGLGAFDHHMLKEIHEQPTALERLTAALTNSQRAAIRDLSEKIQDAEKVMFTAAGTSYHASLLGVYFLQKAGIDAQTLISSEFKNYERVDDETVLIAVSQSGETRDTLDAIEFSKANGATIASVVNMPHSAIQRESAVSIEVQAGPETAVAATKTFSNTVLALLYLAIEAGYDGTIDKIADGVESVIAANEATAAELAADLEAGKLGEANDLYVIGRGSTYPIAREIALKLKEVPYVHAEGMMGGELKHGTLALIEDGTPVLALIPDEADEIQSNIHEIEARGGNVIKVSPHFDDFDIPSGRDGFPFYATTIGFLLAYYLGKERGCPIDKPRNLAKTVTVR